MENMTNKQLMRLYNNVVNRVYQLFAGGTSFGVDLPTLRVSAPSWYNTYMMVADEIKRRM